MEHVLDTRDHPADERLDRWNALLWNELAPMTVSVPDEGSFHASMRVAPLGPVSVATVDTSPLRSRRSTGQVRAHDPEDLLVAVCERGVGSIAQPSCARG